MRIPDKKTSAEWMEGLIKWHEEIKNHPFRKHFQGDQESGTWKFDFREYNELIYRCTELLINLHYYSTDPILTKDDTEFIHDFRSFLLTIGYLYAPRYKTDWLDEPDDRHPEIIPRKIYEKTGITDINNVMIFFEKFIGDIHQFIETKQFNRIAVIQYEPVAEPHNGYYYKHMIELEKVNDEWVPTEEILWINKK